MFSVIDDLSKLTTIPKTTVEKLCKLSSEIMCQDVYEDIMDGNDITELNIGIGTLYIKNDGTNLKYKFEPSTELERLLISTIQNEDSPLSNDVEQHIKEKVIHTYKDIL